MEQLEAWEKLISTNAPISERIKLASLDGIMDQMQEKRTLNVPKLEIEDPICLAIFSTTGFILYSKIFTETPVFDEKIIGNFISMSKQMHSESLDRMKFGEFMVLLDSIDDFSLTLVV